MKKKSKEIPENFIPLLLDLLIRTDQLWLPFRSFSFATSHNRGVAIIQRRREFRKIGLPLVYGGSDTDRQSGSRSVAAAKKAGLVEVHGRGRGRGVRLTRFADDYIRSITPSKRLDESWPILGRVEAARQSNAGRTNAGFTWEGDIVSQRTDDQFQALADDALPLLAWGLLEATSDTQGRLGFRTTASGLDALAAGPMPAPDYVPGYRPELADDFIAADSAALAERENWMPEDKSEVWIPLSAGRWPVRKSEGNANGQAN